MVAPSFRQIIDLSDFDNSMSILPPGQSGNLVSPNAKDQFELWLKGEYKPMLWKKESVLKNEQLKILLIASK